jgi:hypothetical protein
LATTQNTTKDTIIVMNKFICQGIATLSLDVFSV